MVQFPVSTSSEQSIHAALELSKNSWLLAIQVWKQILQAIEEPQRTALAPPPPNVQPASSERGSPTSMEIAL